MTTDLDLYRALPQSERDRLGFAKWKEETRIGTHGPDCHTYGRAHYECALREIERLQAANAHLDALFSAALQDAERYKEQAP